MQAGMEVVYGRCSGIDVHKDEIVVCLITGPRQVTTRKYGTLTRELQEMVSWLKGASCEIVAMESAGSYWYCPNANQGLKSKASRSNSSKNERN